MPSEAVDITTPARRTSAQSHCTDRRASLIGDEASKRPAILVLWAIYAVRAMTQPEVQALPTDCHRVLCSRLPHGRPATPSDARSSHISVRCGNALQKRHRAHGERLAHRRGCHPRNSMSRRLEALEALCCTAWWSAQRCGARSEALALFAFGNVLCVVKWRSDDGLSRWWADRPPAQTKAVALKLRGYFCRDPCTSPTPLEPRSLKPGTVGLSTITHRNGQRKGSSGASTMETTRLPDKGILYSFSRGCAMPLVISATAVPTSAAAPPCVQRGPEGDGRGCRLWAEWNRAQASNLGA